MRNTAICLLVFVLAVLCVIGIGAQQGQKVDKHDEAAQAEDKLLDEQLPVVDFNAPKPTAAAERAKRQLKDRRHNLHKQPISERRTWMWTVYDWPADFPPLPVQQSTTIVIGKVSEATAHISDDKSGVYSEVAINVDEVLKGKAETSVVVEREGGRVRFPSGTIFRYVVVGMGIPKAGHQYLLFLKQLEDGDFSLLTGYELINGRVIPLDETGVVPFQKYKDWDEMKFINEVRESINRESAQV